MPLLNIPIDLIELYGLVLLRVSGLMLLMPVFGSAETGRSVKVGLIATFALVLTATMKSQPPALPETGAGLVLAAAMELFFGLAAGFLIRWVVEAVVIGAQLVGFQMGFAIVNVVDPTTGSTVSLLAAFESRVALLVFLVSGLYRAFLEAIAVSYDLVPIGGVAFQAGHVKAYVDLMGMAFSMSITLAGAPIVALLLSKVVLGIIARTVPQMNVFIVGFPLTIGVGLLAVAAMMPLFVRAVEACYGDSIQQMLTFMKSVGP